MSQQLNFAPTIIWPNTYNKKKYYSFRITLYYCSIWVENYLFHSGIYLILYYTWFVLFLFPLHHFQVKPIILSNSQCTSVYKYPHLHTHTYRSYKVFAQQEDIFIFFISSELYFGIVCSHPAIFYMAYYNVVGETDIDSMENKKKPSFFICYVMVVLYFILLYIHTYTIHIYIEK